MSLDIPATEYAIMHALLFSERMFDTEIYRYALQNEFDSE